MAGWRLGWVYGSEGAWSACCASTSTRRFCASAPAQYAAEAALRGDHGVVDEMTASFERRRDLLLDGFDEIGIDCPTPQGAFYAMPRVPEGFVDECLDRGVVVVPGEAFGEHGRGHARISYATDESELREALDVMADAYEAAK